MRRHRTTAARRLEGAMVAVLIAEWRNSTPHKIVVQAWNRTQLRGSMRAFTPVCARPALVKWRGN